ncbi:MAG: hypothetical protein IJ530_14955 [Treponema sp.]|uniref:hypothetical protein n=1 Tax=Treponema sp. TaxID=166 RepID=UPI0025CC78EF|nr:hypothetical protein [Treponema sp.]MBQ8681028.1 hypothetical protein [Treponema sp.]
MTKKQLEKYQKKSDDFASDQTEATADGAGETQAGNENEDSSGKSEEAAEEDDDKSFLESVWETIVDFFTGGSKDDDKTVEESDSSDGKTETDKATSENKTAEGENKENSTKTEVAAASSDAASTANKNDSDLSTPERSDASKSDDGGSWWSSFCDKVAGFVSAVVGFFEDVYDDFTASGGTVGLGTIGIKSGENVTLNFALSPSSDTRKDLVVEYNSREGACQYPNCAGSQEDIIERSIYNDEFSNIPVINPTGKASVIFTIP